MKVYGGRYLLSPELASLGLRAVGVDVRIHSTCLMVGLENISIGDHVRVDAFTSLIAGDGHINIAVAGQVIWERFCRAVAPQLLQNPNYAKGADRSKHRDALNAEIGEIIRTRTSKEWVDALNEAGIPSGPIYTMDQVYADPQVKHLGIAQPLDTPQRGTVEFASQPMTLSRTSRCSSSRAAWRKGCAMSSRAGGRKARWAPSCCGRKPPPARRRFERRCSVRSSS